MPLLDRYRAGIIPEASRHIGAHYVWGATGNYPGMISGFISPIASSRVNRTYSTRLSMQPNTLTANEPFLCAARCESRGRPHICNGRSYLPQVRSRRRFELGWLSDSARLQQALQTPQDWIWPRINDEPALDGRIVWGEPCFGVQHFDCIGFINYCILRVCGAAHHPSISELRNAWRNRPSAPAPLQAGDIIIPPGEHHIMFVESPTRMIHAKSTHYGVVRDEIGALAEGTIVIRPTEDFLLGRYR